MIVHIIVGLAFGIAFIFILSMAVEAIPLRPEVKTMTGEVVCLSPKPGQGMVLAICITGFHDIENGKYYVLISDMENAWLHTAEGSGEVFTVTGTVKSLRSLEPERYDGLLDMFDAAGALDDITSTSTLDGSTSIYEVQYRHGRYLSDILSEIDVETEGGYSMGIDRCDGEPCIRIVLEKEISEVIDRIPRELEGYMIDVQVS